MIVTIVCDVLGEENNGTTIAAMNLIRHLKKQGHTVRIVCGDEKHRGEENYYIVSNRDFGKFLNSLVDKVGVMIAKPDDEILKNAITGADVVHIMVPLSLGLRATRIAKSLNVPITAGFHMQAENLTCYLKLNKMGLVNSYVYKFIYKNLYSQVDAIHYPTEFIKNLFEDSIKKKTPGHVISNGVHSYVKRRESEKPEEYKDKIVILSTGRYAREKSQDTLLKAVKYSKYRDKLVIILAGQGLKDKQYLKLAKSLKINAVFKLFGRNEIIDVLNYCDMYVHPAEIELEGIACLEAIACGKLTIVSNSKLSATRQFAIDSKCVFKKRNPRDLAKVIDYWIEHPEEAKEYEEKYLKSAKLYALEDCMKEMEEMLKGVIKNKVEN